MGRAPCCEKVGLRRGRWTAEEDEILTNYIKANGEGSWRSLPKNAGLLRCGKSCRLRWINYLRSDLKRGNISAEEDLIIINLHATLGNRWSLIATHLPGRTDNEIKNYWNSHLSRKIQSETPVGHFSKPRAAGKKQRSCRTSRSAMKNNKPCSPTNMPNQMGLPSSGPPAPENDALSTTTTPCFGEERENGSFGLEREEFSLDDVMGFAEEREREDAMVKMSQEVKRESVAQDASKKKTRNGDVEEGCFSHFTFSFGEDMKVGGLGLDWDTNWEWEETWGEDEKRLYCPWVNDYENEMNHDQQQNAIVSWLFS